ncbi:hypothetical protein OBBRIDRAFT_796999 [Obba rivulosa]|uniref:Uncharacterized protein n=1 Tax=Obba rivulosa TaxID=1052685 RepID=A0A8E2AQQ4_9APHY|nr:hypothetical protein OBBRIDRAFT_796999 [Obba rivulosa]
MAQLAFAASEVVAITFESLFYGLYMMLFKECVQVLLRKHKGDILSTRLAAVTGSLFVLITWHLVIDITRLVVAFNVSTEIIGVEVQFNDLRSLGSVMETSVYVAMTTVSDAFLLYRTFVIWNRNVGIMIVPMVLFVADVGTGIAAACSLGLLNPGETFYVQHQTEITTAFFSTTLALNGICTALIASRIWWHQHMMAGLVLRTGTSMSLNRVATIMVESGAIYSSTLAVMIATYVSESTQAFYVFLEMIPPVIGIVFSLIIVRVRLGQSHETAVAMSTFVAHAIQPTTQDEENATAFNLSDLHDSRQNRSIQHMPKSNLLSDHCGDIGVVKAVSIVAEEP